MTPGKWEKECECYGDTREQKGLWEKGNKETKREVEYTELNQQ